MPESNQSQNVGIDLLRKLPAVRWLYDELTFQAPLWVYGLSVLTGVSLLFQALGYQQFVTFVDNWLRVVHFPSSPVIYTSLPSDPLLWRVLGVQTAHHVWIMFGITGVYYWLTEHMDMEALPAVGGIWFAIAWHETLWWVTDIAWILLNHVTWNPLLFFGWIEMAAAVTYFAWYVVGAPWPRRYMAAMAGYYLVWFAAGFPVTINFYVTQWYFSPWVNAIELGSWLFAIVAYMVLEAPSLSQWFSTFYSTLNNNPVSLSD